MAIDINNISFINYLWTKKNSDGTLTGIRLSKSNLPTDTVYSPSSSIANAVPRYDGTTEKIIKDTGVTISDANLLSAPMIETGAENNNYFQSRKFRGEGNAATYYHAIDFGFAGHNQVDFYEYGGLWNFWKNTNATPTTDSSNLCLQIGDTYVKNKGNTFTWPTTSGTLALTTNIPTVNNATLTIQKNGTNVATFTANSSTNQTANITVPTKVSQLTNDSGFLTSHQDISGKVNKSGDTMTGNLSPSTNKGASLGTPSLYWSNIYGTTIYENGTSLANKYASKTNIPEAYLTWGGKNFSGSYGPIDAAMVPELGANRLAFMPTDAVTIEYSRDGGATWTDYGAEDYQKIGLFNGIGSGFTIGKASSGAGNIATNKYQLRVNIYTSTGRVYTVLNKFVIYLSTSGTNNNWCTIRARKQSDYTAGNDKWTTFADKISVSGWSGYNVINTSGITTYGNTASSQYGHIQFIFGCDTGSTNNSYPGLTINKIFGFGGVGWTTPSTMAKTGHMYTYDSSQNVTFPAAITSGAVNSYNILPRGNNTYNLGSSNSKWANVYATTIHENGKTLSETYVKYSAAQTLNDAQKTQARSNIGAGTVTSVRVQAGTGLSSSQNTAQTSTLNTTISIASGYKLPTTTEWAERPSINDAYSISAGNGIVLTPSASSLEISVNSTSSVTSGSTALVTSGAVYDAIQSAITTALNTSV